MKNYHNPIGDIFSDLLLSICHLIGSVLVLTISFGTLTCEKFQRQKEFNDTNLDWSPFVKTKERKELKKGIAQTIGFLFILGIYLLTIN